MKRTYQPHNLRRKRTHGFPQADVDPPADGKVISRRRAKGRKRLSVTVSGQESDRPPRGNVRGASPERAPAHRTGSSGEVVRKGRAPAYGALYGVPRLLGGRQSAGWGNPRREARGRRASPATASSGCWREFYRVAQGRLPAGDPDRDRGSEAPRGGGPFLSVARTASRASHGRWGGEGDLPCGPDILLIGLLRLYQTAVSPYIGNCCRFPPQLPQYK